MNPLRIIGAGIVGGIVMFCWGAAAHMGLQTDLLFMRSLPAESPLTAEMKSTFRERGFYFFPGMNEQDKSEAAMKAWEEKLKAGPRGVVIFDPTGSEVMGMGQLGTEFASNIAAALLLAIALAHIQASWAKRAFLAGLLGVFAVLSIDASYWNWYRFPDGFVIASLIEQGVGWLLAGAAIACTLGRNPARSPAPVA